MKITFGGTIPLFVVFSHRPEFVQKWRYILGGQGEVSEFSSPAVCPGSNDGWVAALAVLDLGGDQRSPAELINEIQGRLGNVKVVLSGASFSVEREMAALAVGVVACCGDDESDDDMGRVVSAVLKGGVWISRNTLPHVVSRLQALSIRNKEAVDRQGSPEPADAMGNVMGLTSRQLDVARLVGKGESNKAIARILGITDRTVKAHLTTIFDKLGVADRVHLALYVTRHLM